MPKRTVFTVTGHKGEWTISERGHKPTRGTFFCKETAIERARKMARTKPLSQVIVKGLNGQVQTEYTYGHDPRNIPG